MLRSVDAGRLSTPASPRIVGAINHKAIEHARYLLAQNSAQLASDGALDVAEREHHATIARLAAR